MSNLKPLDESDYSARNLKVGKSLSDDISLKQRGTVLGVGTMAKLGVSWCSDFAVFPSL